MPRLIILMLLLAPVAAGAVTREAAIRYAVSRAEDIRISRETANVLRARGDGATAFTLPQATFESAYIELDDTRESLPEMFSAFDSPSRDISVGYRASQLLFAGGRIRSSWALRKAIYEQAAILDRIGEREVRRTVKLAFDAVLLEQAVLAIVRDRLDQRMEELRDARDLWEAGMVTSLDVRQARLNVNSARTSLEAEQTAFRESLITFNLALGRSGKDELWLPEGSLTDIPDTGPLLMALRQALVDEALLDVKAREMERLAARYSYRIAEGEKWPEIALVSTGTTSGEREDEMDESWSLGLTLTWYLFDGGRISANTARTRSELRIAEDTLSKTRKALAGDIEIIADKVRSVQNRSRIEEESVILSEKNYEDARSQYRAGTITQVELGVFSLSFAESRYRLQRLRFLQRELITAAEALLEFPD